MVSGGSNICQDLFWDFLGDQIMAAILVADLRSTWIPEVHGFQKSMDSRRTWIPEDHPGKAQNLKRDQQQRKTVLIGDLWWFLRPLPTGGMSRIWEVWVQKNDVEWVGPRPWDPGALQAQTSRSCSAAPLCQNVEMV